MANEPVKKSNSNWLKTIIVLLSLEKIIQHSFVTLAFAFNFQGIRESIAGNPTLLMILGGIEVVIFIVCGWGVTKDLPWSLNGLVGLALLDIFGEMYAQGKIIIDINISFVVAVALLILAVLYKRQLAKKVLAKNAASG